MARSLKGANLKPGQEVLYRRNGTGNAIDATVLKIGSEFRAKRRGFTALAVLVEIYHHEEDRFERTWISANSVEAKP